MGGEQGGPGLVPTPPCALRKGAAVRRVPTAHTDADLGQRDTECCCIDRLVLVLLALLSAEYVALDNLLKPFTCQINKDHNRTVLPLLRDFQAFT